MLFFWDSFNVEGADEGDMNWDSSDAKDLAEGVTVEGNGSSRLSDALEAAMNFIWRNGAVVF